MPRHNYRLRVRPMTTFLVVIPLLTTVLSGCATTKPAQARHQKHPAPCPSTVLSCLTGDMSHAGGKTNGRAYPGSGELGPPPQCPTPANLTQPLPRHLGTSVLGPLQADLSSGDQQLILDAMDQLPATAADRIARCLDGLDSSKAGVLATNLSLVLEMDSANAGGYAGALVGIRGAGNGPVQVAAGSVLRSISGLFDVLPHALAGGNSQISSFITEGLSTTVPYLEGILQAGVAQVPPAIAPLLLAAAYHILEPNDPAELANLEVLFEAPKAQALTSRYAYQAGLDCGASSSKCTAFDRWVTSIAAARTPPPAVQRDAVNCMLLPLCTSVQSKAVIAWVKSGTGGASSGTAALQQLISIMSSNSYAAAQGWIYAF
ncbi:MAG: hypothetical protein M1350_04525 [Actinobacteria bacterium]|nr:hypothetical protein [Actinomycetota bacterium]